nr:MAG TPA: hypothetical protein [Caudoviricetes sp.]
MGEVNKPLRVPKQGTPPLLTRYHTKKVTLYL